MPVLDESVRIKVNKRLGDTAGSSTDVNNRTPQAPSMAAAALISSDTRHSADDRSIITMPEFFITNSAQREKNGAAFGKRVLQTLTRSDEGIRNDVSIVVGGSIRSSADVVKAIALGADAVYIATAALLSMGCHLCRSCNTGKCNWGIATQRADLVKRLNPEIATRRLVNLVHAWDHEIKEMMGGMGINSIESLRGNRLMLRGLGLNQKELDILGIQHAGE